MKRFLGLIVLLVVLAAMPLVAGADTPAPGGPFNTAFRVQNLGSEVAHCTYNFYDSGGVERFSSSLPDIAVGDSAFVYVPNLSVSAGQYAAVVSCDQEVAAVVNYSDADSGASYSGISGSDIGTTLYAPGIYDNYYNYYSNVVVQNASGSPINITLEIYRPGSSTPVYTKTESNVPANGFVSFEQEGLTQLNDNQFYSAKIKGTGNIAAVVNIYGKSAVANQLYSYNPFASGSTVAYAPVILNNYYGYNSALVIQNLSETTTANVRITYTNGTVKTTSIAPGAADSRYTPYETGLPSGNNGLVGAKIECTNGQPIVVLVNESTAKNRAASYSGFAAGATTVYAPIVMKRYARYNTSITCQNVGTAATDISVRYGGISGSTTFENVKKDAIQLIYQPQETKLSNNFIGSATMTASQPIVCVVNEDMNEAPEVNQVMDQLYAYNGIGK